MRFMMMHKLTPKLEQGLPPSADEIAAIHGMMAEAAEAGVLLGGEGLRPSRDRWHVSYRDGERVVTAGPFPDRGELISSYAQLTVRTLEEAFGWLDRFAAILGDVEMFLGPCTEPWDLGMVPKPENPPLRLLAIHQADKRTEAGEPLAPDQMARMSALIEDMSAAGVLQSTQALTSSAHGARVLVENGQHSVVDGPFAESKELISGFAIFELPSKAEALEWAARWADVVKVNQVEVRPLPE